MIRAVLLLVLPLLAAAPRRQEAGDWKPRFDELSKRYFKATAAERPKAIQDLNALFRETLERSRGSFEECREICAYYETQGRLFGAHKDFQTALKSHQSAYFNTAFLLATGPGQFEELRAWCSERRLAEEKKRVEELLGRLRMAARPGGELLRRAQLRSQRQHARKVVQEFLATRTRTAVAELEKVAAWMKKEGYAPPAAKDRAKDLVRRLLGEDEREIAGLAKEIDALADTASTPALEKQFDLRVGQLVKEYTGRLMTAVEKCLAAGEPGLGFTLFRRLLKVDPENARARRALGQVKIEDRWLRPFEAEQVRKGIVWDDRWGWIIAKERSRYEAGEYGDPETKQWAPLADLNRRRSDPESPWKLRSEHFDLHSTADLALTVRVLARLEAFFLQAFAEYDLFFARGGDKGAELIFGVAPADKRLVVWFYRSEEQFKAHANPPVQWAAGFYDPSKHASFFYAHGDVYDVETLQHELTHQILGEYSAGGAPSWLAEGAAVYLQAADFRDGILTVGEVDHNDRLVEYRNRLRSGEKEHGLKEVIRFRPGGVPWDSGDIGKNYRGAGAVVHFLMTMDGGRYRGDFIDLLRDAYHGGEKSLEDTFGLTVDTLDLLMARFYKECVTRTEARVERLDTSAAGWVAVDDPAAFGRSEWPIALSDPKRETAGVRLERAPVETVAGLSVRVRVEKGSKVFAGLSLEEMKRMVYIDAGSSSVVMGRWEKGSWAFDWAKSCETRPEYVLSVVVQSGEYVVYVDGREMGRVATAETALERTGLYVYGGSASFDQVRVRPGE